MISVIIPAFNEEDTLAKTLESVKNSINGVSINGIPVNAELIVVDNNSSDNTSQIAESHGAKVFFEPHNQISKARNLGAKNAKGSYFVFIDADTYVSPELLQLALDKLNTGDFCGGGAVIQMDRIYDTFSFRYYNWLIRFANRFQLVSGCFMYVRADAFRDIGGFDERLYSTEEVFFAKKLKKWGKKNDKDFSIIHEHTAVTSSRKLEKPFYFLKAHFIGILFPLAIFTRRFSWYWYKRNSS